jgi:hypothetical protein
MNVHGAVLCDVYLINAVSISLCTLPTSEFRSCSEVFTFEEVSSR